TPNMAVLHQAFVTQRANQRGGNVKTKTRGEVQGSTRKIRRQKTTGAARAGTNRSPIRVGGGRAFGPRPRSYAKDFPKKMRRLAIRSALSGKVADGQLVVIDQLVMERPKTKEMIRLLENVGFNRSALVVTGSADRMVLASLRNLDKTKTLPAAYLNVVDMMNHAGLLMTEEAVRVAEKLWGKKEPTDGVRPARRHRKPEPLAVAPERPTVPEKPAAPPRRSRADVEGAPPVAEAAGAETAPTGRKTRFVPKTPKPEAAASVPEASPHAEATPEPEAKTPARPRRAPKAEASTEAAAPKAARRRKAEPEAKGDGKPKPAPKPRATRAKAKPAAEATNEAPKPRKRTTKKTEEGK
ncbi:MAG: 50S ribosomal protein L4, partial [Chloroflexota bacterium]|nr:50S ribosomal protein L4 [Chloroflexota bacterium]